jgi:DNA repair and recombination protein RAD54B
MLTNCRRKPTKKKNKTWDGDGVLSIRDGYAHLQDAEDGREIGKTMWKLPLFPGSTLSVGGKDVEIDAVLLKEDFLAGKPFLGGKLQEKEPAPPPFKRPTEVVKIRQEEAADREPENILNPASQHTKAKFRNPMMEQRPPGEERKPPPIPKPRHNPNAPGALVMKRPESVPRGRQVVDVVMDPLIGQHLREHQREGVQFMYECVMGMRESGEGAILADEMGLGKTLQTIALLWTLLKQNPIDGAGPVVKKALIVCPVTLVQNWRKEFRKWLGSDRLGVFVVDNDKNIRLRDFTKGRAYNVMIIGYEKLRKVQKELGEGMGIDIVIADEGHRLKTEKNKAAAAIRSLSTERRVILSGTPLQNDLSEFFAMVDLVNPGLLGKYNTFKREFENPIVKARQPEATEKDIEKGEGRSEELARLTGQFILRRTVDVIAQYLPPKTEAILFCKPTNAQADLYRSVLESPVFGAVLGSTEASLQLINVLKKVCNSPSLLTKQSSDESKPSENITNLLASIPPKLCKVDNGASAKLLVLDSLLHQLRINTEEKIVLVSNYTSTLDILGNLLSAAGHNFLRLDGSTPANKRQALVDKFNKETPEQCFAFLLSAKAGGAGLNLIGASRLVLFDVDWNPATDIQAMARIHRDGQKNHCFIYRFLVKGALDEKIYQRQVMKMGLADAVVDSKKTGQSFSKEELKALFTLEEGDGPPKTHELLGCACEGKGNAPEKELVLMEDEEEDGGKKGFGTSMDDPAADEESNDESLPEIGKLVSAADINLEEQERKIKEKAEKARKKAKAKYGKGDGQETAALMKFLHIDVERVRKGEEDVEALVEDTILLNCLKKENSRIAYVFAKTTS